jgi:hypothetical protein
VEDVQGALSNVATVTVTVTAAASSSAGHSGGGGGMTLLDLLALGAFALMRVGRSVGAPCSVLRRGAKNLVHRTKAALFVLATTTGLLALAPTKAQAPAESPLGIYGKTSTYCGKEAIPLNPPVIPQLHNDISAANIKVNRCIVGALFEDSEVLIGNRVAVNNTSSQARPALSTPS